MAKLEKVEGEEKAQIKNARKQNQVRQEENLQDKNSQDSMISKLEKAQDQEEE